MDMTHLAHLKCRKRLSVQLVFKFSIFKRCHYTAYMFLLIYFLNFFIVVESMDPTAHTLDAFIETIIQSNGSLYDIASYR